MKDEGKRDFALPSRELVTLNSCFEVLEARTLALKYVVLALSTMLLTSLLADLKICL